MKTGTKQHSRYGNISPAVSHTSVVNQITGCLLFSFPFSVIRWPKRVKHKSVYQNTKQFPKTQINFPNLNQFTKTQINFLKHKSVYQNTKQFLKTQTNFPKHKSVYQSTNQLHKTQINFAKHKSKDWALALSLSKSLEGTHSQKFSRPTWRLLICCPDVRKCSATTVGLKKYKSVSIKSHFLMLEASNLAVLMFSTCFFHFWHS